MQCMDTTAETKLVIKIVHMYITLFANRPYFRANDALIANIEYPH